MGGCRVYVGGLNHRVKVRDLEKFFRRFRKLRDVVIKNGFGFVEFDDDRDASDAVYEMNGRELLGGRYGAPSRTKYRLSVNNLSSKVSWQDLKDFMRQAGEVTYADAHEGGKNKGVIEFATYNDMRNALIKLDGKILEGRKIILEDEYRRDRRSRSRSYSRSRSRGRSRSRSRRSSRSSRFYTIS
ncbi:Serine/arginine-rich splicing factor 4 [Armadillidium vulgare]|nr:Serine/arginine-rich splicing factor 4 [Armadillidium vulgare]